MKEDMNGKYEKLEHLLKQARPVAPTPQLKVRVTSAAGKAWGRATLEVPWQVPLRRLAVSAAAAVLVVSLAKAFSNCIAPGWHHTESPATRSESIDLNDLSLTGYDAYVRHLTASTCRSSGASGLTLRDHMERVREMLKESRSSENGRPSTSPPGRSWLAPTAGRTMSWS